MSGNLGPYELNTIILGDCLEAMVAIPDNSVDSIVCDPPYGLSKEPDMVEVLTHWLNGDDYTHRGGGFMGKSWDSFVPGPAIWRECFRVMKPGGCLMAFGGTRTCDLLSIAIRLAGFQRFDELVWLHGQGFSKGLAVDKAIDQYFGKLGEREVIGIRTDIWGSGVTRFEMDDSGTKNGRTVELAQKRAEKSKTVPITAPATEAAALFSGWRSALKPAHEVILCFWKPREKSFAHNALKWGVAGLNIDECRIATDWETDPTRRGWQGGDATNSTSVFGNAGQPRVSHPNPSGRFPTNCLLSHDPRCVRVGVKRVRGSKPSGVYGTYEQNGVNDVYGKGLHSATPNTPPYADPDGLETVPDYRCHPDCAVAMLDEQAGVRPSSARPNLTGKHYEQKRNVYGKYNGMPHNSNHDDSGSASRFFYCPKAPPREKWFYCETCDDVYPYAQRDDHAHGKPKGQRKHQIAHPTVKPLSIANYTLSVLEYLCRLTKTPAGGIILDPFGGSGTTALAALANGRPFLLIENDPIYHRIAEKRIEQVMKEPRQLEML